MSKVVKILIVGANDSLTMEYQVRLVHRIFKAAVVEVCGTEYEFRQKLAVINRNPPAVVFMWIRFAWTRPAPDMPVPPPEVIKQGYHKRAGFRCRELLHKIVPHVPVVLHSTESEDNLSEEIARLPANSCYVAWQDNRELTRALLQAVRG